METSKRIARLIEMVPKCGSMVDVGTDHGYVPIGVVRAGKAERAIASDVRKGPLKIAEMNILEEGLSDRIRVAMGSGLKTVRPKEVDGAVIAGMGGNLVRDILMDSMDVVMNLDFLIVQPAQNPEVIREYLYTRPYEVISEDLVREDDGRYYEYIMVRYTGRISEQVGTPLGYELSPYLLKNGHPLLSGFIGEKLSEAENIILKLDLNSDNARAKKADLEEKIFKLKEIEKWL